MAKFHFAESMPPGSPLWMVSYTDLICLLVTFFVMLMSFSTMDENEAMVIMGAFGDNHGGILSGEDHSSVVPPPTTDRMSAVHAARGATRPHARPPEELAGNIEETGQRKLAGELEIDFTAAPDGLLVTFGPKAVFAPGSAEPGPELRRDLAELSRVLAHCSNSVVVEGFSDGASEAESLGFARAAAAARAMLDASELPRDLLQVSGFGPDRTRAASGTALARADNRRVEVRILALSKARERLLRSQFAAQRAEAR